MEKFIQKLQELDSGFEVRQNTNSPEMSGIYWNGYCAYIGIPSIIKEKREESYTDSYGVVHRSAEEALGMAEQFLDRIKSDEEFKDLITTNDEEENVTVPVIKVRENTD